MEKLDVITKKVDVLPMVKYYMDQLGVYDLFSKYVQNPTRSPVDSAQILSIMGPRQKLNKQLFVKTEDVNEPILQP